MTTPLQHTSLGELGGWNPLLSTSLGELGDGVIPPIPPFTPEPVHAPGAGEDAEARRTRILLEDEIIMAVLVAFLESKDR